MSLREAAQGASIGCIGKPRAPEAEVYLSRGEERGIERRDGKLDGIQQAVSEGVGLRLLSGGRMGFACAGGATLETVQRLYGEIFEQLSHLEADAHKELAQPQPDPGDQSLGSPCGTPLFSAKGGFDHDEAREREKSV